MITSSLVQNTTSSIFTSAVGKTYAVVNTMFCNYTNNLSGSVDVYLKKNGEPLSNTNKIIFNKIINPTDSLFISDKFILSDGDSLWASASINDTLSSTIVYMEI